MASTEPMEYAMELINRKSDRLGTFQSHVKTVAGNLERITQHARNLAAMVPQGNGINPRDYADQLVADIRDQATFLRALLKYDAEYPMDPEKPRSGLFAHVAYPAPTAEQMSDHLVEKERE